MGIVLHCLHLSTARSVEDCEKCLNLLLPLALLLLPMVSLLSLRMQRFLRSKDSTLVMEDMGPLLPRKTELFSGKKPLLTEKELASTAILIMMGRPLLSATLLARMGSGS